MQIPEVNWILNFHLGIYSVLCILIRKHNSHKFIYIFRRVIKIALYQKEYEWIQMMSYY